MKTHCSQGHALAGNVYIRPRPDRPNPAIECRTCRAESNARESAVRGEARRYIDDVAVDRLADGEGAGATISEKHAALRLCFVRSYSNVETARRVGVTVRTVERHRAKWKASLDQVGH